MKTKTINVEAVEHHALRLTEVKDCKIILSENTFQYYMNAKGDVLDGETNEWYSDIRIFYDAIVFKDAIEMASIVWDHDLKLFILYVTSKESLSELYFRKYSEANKVREQIVAWRGFN